MIVVKVSPKKVEQYHLDKVLLWLNVIWCGLNCYLDEQKSFYIFELQPSHTKTFSTFILDLIQQDKWNMGTKIIPRENVNLIGLLKPSNKVSK